MKNYLLVSVLTTVLFSCNQGMKNNDVIITLKNTADIDLVDKAISINRAELKLSYNKDIYPLLLNTKGDTITSQLNDTSGDGEWDELFFVIDIPAQKETTVTLSSTEDSISYEKRTTARFGKRDSKTDPVEPRLGDTLLANQLPRSIGYQPYQTDGPSWENDKVGFRHYLDGRNSKDVFGKKASFMSPSTVGINKEGAVEDNYHVMAAWGRDIMAVGNSVGIGGIALKIGDQMLRLGVTAADSINNVDTTIFAVKESGPVKSVLDFQYNNWNVLGRKYHLSEEVSIWPGMYAYKNNVRVKDVQGDETLLVGLVNLDPQQKPKELIIDNKWVILYTHDRETYNHEWILGLGLILPYDVYKGYSEAPLKGPLSTSYMAELKLANDVPIEYYAVAGWELAADPGFNDANSFEQYIVRLTKQLTAKVEIELKSGSEK